MKRLVFTLFVAALAVAFGPRSASALQFASAKPPLKTAAVPLPAQASVQR